jgi:hypothetical protein
VEVLHVSPSGRYAISNESGRHVEFVLPPAGDVDKGLLLYKPLGRREPEAAAAACYERHFALQSWHHSLPSD